MSFQQKPLFAVLSFFVFVAEVIATPFDNLPYAPAPNGYYWLTGSYHLPNMKFRSGDEAIQAAWNADELDLLKNGWTIISRTITSYVCSQTPSPGCQMDGTYERQSQQGTIVSVNYQLSSWQTAAGPLRAVNGEQGSQCGACPIQQSQAMLFNPINAGTGNKHQAEIDYVGSGAFPLQFIRYYDSGTFDVTSFTMPITSQWHTNYDRRLYYTAFNGNSVVNVYTQSGRTLGFYLSGGNWIPQTSDITEKLISIVDGGGNITGFKLINTDDETETYNIKGRLISITNRAGLTQTLTYDTATGFLQTITDPFGRTLGFTYFYDVNAGRYFLSTMTDPAGKVYTYQYPISGTRNLISITYPDNTPGDPNDNPKRIYHYENFNDLVEQRILLTGITDENNDPFATFNYDTQGRGVLSKHAGDADKGTLTYNVDGTTTAIDALNTSRTYTFQTILGTPKVTNITQPGAGNVARSYDTNGFPQSVTDYNGNVTNYVHNSRGLETSRTEAFGTPQARTVTTTWHATFRLPLVITEPNRTTTFTYHATTGVMLTKVIATTVPSARSLTWTYTYNARGQVLTINGPRTDVTDLTTFTYDAVAGNLLTVTNALSQVTQITSYDAHGKPLTIVDPNGLTTTLTYDTRGRILTSQVGSELTSYLYDKVGQLKKVTLPDASFVEYTYDAAHRLTEIKDNLNNKIVYTLDLMGNRTAEQVFDPASTLRQTRSRIYTALNRLDQDLGAQSQITKYTYDNNGNVTKIEDPLLHANNYQFDALNRLKQITDPNSGITQYQYNTNSELTAVIDPKNFTTNYNRNGLGEILTQVSPDTGTTTFTYDTGGNVKTKKDARNKTATYTLDALNRVSQIAFGDQTQVFTYDTGTNGIGRLVKFTDTSGNTEYSYDQKGRIVRKQQQTNNINQVVEYGYNPTTGQLTSMTYPSGKVITYGYDTAGRVNSISANGAVILNAVTYEPFAAPKTWVWGNAASNTITYDLDGRIQNHTLGSATRNIGYDTASRITQLDEGTAPTTRTIGYDNLDRVNSYITSSSNQGFTFDADSNRSTITMGANTYNYTYPATNNKLTSISGPAAKTYTYDASGNITADGTNTWTYNNAGRMTKVVWGANTVNYTLNALGQRVTKSGSGVTGTPNRYVYDEQHHLIGEYDTNGVAIQETVYLGDKPVAVLTTSESTQDNTTSGNTVVGTWATETAIKGFYGTNYRSIAAGTGVNSFTFKLTIPSNQSYYVYARWVANATHASNAKYDVIHAGGTTTVTVNQQQDSGEWYLLGTYTLSSSTNHKVKLTDNANGKLIADAVKIVPVNQAAQTYFIHTDHLNTPRLIKDTLNQTRWTYDSVDPYGNNVPNENPSGLGVFTYNKRESNYFYDKETGLYYAYLRDCYNPATGRFCQSDPIGLEGGINTYGYVGGNPVSRVDPSGLIAPAIAACLANPAACATLGAGAILAIGNGIKGTWNAIKSGATSTSSTGEECCSDGYVPVYRVVGENEYIDIQASKQYSISNNPTGFTQKQFWLNQSSVAWWATAEAKMAPSVTKNNRYVVTSYVCRSTLNKGYLFTDAGQPAVSFDTSALPLVNQDANMTDGIKTLQTIPKIN